MASKTSETITENIFRNFYGSKTYIEKSAIPKEYGFVSKKIWARWISRLF